jgi:hypothetical protein
MANNRRPKKKLPQIKKEIKDFLLSEEGKISKKNIAKLGISLVILAMTLQPQIAQGQHTSHSSHSNTFFSGGRGGHNSNTPHSSSHANHHNHGSGGWC